MRCQLSPPTASAACFGFVHLRCSCNALAKDANSRRRWHHAALRFKQVNAQHGSTANTNNASGSSGSRRREDEGFVALHVAGGRGPALQGWVVVWSCTAAFGACSVGLQAR